MRRHVFLAAVFLGWSGHTFAAGDPAAGQQKSAPCQACHGADGNSPNPQFPRLAGQYPDYLVQALTDYQKGGRKNPIMAPFAANLSQQDMEDLAAYFSTRPNGLVRRP
jgi:cytochrome c553